MKKPEVSVLMAVRNGGAFLEKSLASIAQQSFGDWEMVIVDDASTDGSEKLAAQWAARDPRIRVLHRTSNKGQTASLNEGLAHCRGTWVARQDADDISHPRRLERQTAFMRRHPQMVVLGTQGVLIDEQDARVGLLDVPLNARDISWCAPFLNPFLHTSVLFRRDVVQGCGGYDESFRIAQDYDLWTRLCASHPSANLPARLVSYRNGEESLSRSGRELAFAEADRVSEREARRLLSREWTPEEKQLVSGFRQGLRADRRKDFWRLVAQTEKETSSPLSPRLRAAWHLRLAGAGGLSPVSEVMAAFVTAPSYTTRWLGERFLSS
ncbi:MAG: glycosyltransferase family 2 protein [Chthoniobacterales bacterium]